MSSPLTDSLPSGAGSSRGCSPSSRWLLRDQETRRALLGHALASCDLGKPLRFSGPRFVHP